MAPLLTGVGGGHDIDLRGLAHDGVVLLGHLLSGHHNKLAFASDLGAALVRGDEWFEAFVQVADDYAQQNGLDLADDDHSRETFPDPKEVSAPIRELDVKAAGISSVIWASGFRYDFGWVDLPIFADPRNGPAREPMHRRGLTGIPGLYLVGLQWLSKRKSSLMAGVGEDAAFIAEHIATRM
jgi:putative flavoprotein involved in K+ transport